MMNKIARILNEVMVRVTTVLIIGAVFLFAFNQLLELRARNEGIEGFFSVEQGDLRCGVWRDQMSCVLLAGADDDK